MRLATIHQLGAHGTIVRVDAAANRFEVPWHGRIVCWRRFGEGPPLVLFHGGHGSWMHWILNVESLAKEHTLWVPDLPGFGDSDDLPLDARAPERMQYLIDTTLGTLNTLVGRTSFIDLAGFSFGALVAAELAARRGLVRRMALLGPAGHGGARRQEIGLLDWRATDQVERHERLRHNLAALMLHGPERIDELAMAVHEASCAKTRFRSKAISRTHRLGDALARFHEPLLLIWGEHDVTAVPHRIAPSLAEGQTDREWCVVPGAGHWVQYERNDDVNRLLRIWFAVHELKAKRCQ